MRCNNISIETVHHSCSAHAALPSVENDPVRGTYCELYHRGHRHRGVAFRGRVGSYERLLALLQDTNLEPLATVSTIESETRWLLCGTSMRPIVLQ
jgi:hypothetical protein